MKTIGSTAWLACMLLMTSSAAFAERTAGETIDDSTLITNTKLQLLDDRDVGAGDINVEAYKGAVQLIGFVDSKEEKDAAIARAAKVDGVREVDDALIVMPGDRSFGRVIDDQTLYGKVKLKLANVEGLGEAVAVVVKVREGEVLLGGFVDSRDTISDIEKAVKDVDGVRKVHNGLVAKN